MLNDKKILYSGMQATGTLTLGNYLGALKNWVNLNEEYECIYGVMDLHSLTVRQNPAEFRKNARSLYALYVAAGLNPEKNCIYYQSHVPGHAHLYTYPVLMAADILLYQADVVPVGQDQKQHLEITRDIAQRFNAVYGEVFTVPKAYIPKAGAKIMSLADPQKKMSKSEENPNASIWLMDDRDSIIRKFKRAVTDSDTVVRYAKEKPGISNLMDIYSCVTGKNYDEIEKEFEGKGYGDFKLAVGEAVADELAPLQKRYTELMADKTYIESMIKMNDEKAAFYAAKTLRKVHKKVGLTEMIK